MKNPLLQIEAISGRFELVRDIHEDPSFYAGLAFDTKLQTEIGWQLLLVPGLDQDDKLKVQFQSRSALKHPYVARTREFLNGPSWALLVTEIPEARYFSQIPETQRDEIYLNWLAQALSILESLHRRGSLHLAMSEFSWRVLPEQSGQEEHLFLGDLGLFPDVPLGRRVQAPAVVAVAPEIWAGESVDARADLYALATLFLRQRSQAQFQRFDSPKKLLDLHRGGRMSDLVPKTNTTLNDLLRRMLQSNPLDRPVSALECLREIRGDQFQDPQGEAARPWLESRHRRRQLTLVLSMLHTLLMEGEWETARVWLEEIRPRLSETHGTHLEYLENYLKRHLQPDEPGTYPWEKKVLDPRLRVLLKIEKSDWERRQVHPERSLAVLEEALVDVDAYPDSELGARVLLKRARLKRKGERDAEAMDDLWDAWIKTEGIPGGRLRESICAELAEIFLHYDLAQGAYALLSEALPLAKNNPEEVARLQTLTGLALMKLERWEESGRAFYEGKSGFSALKQLESLIWAGSHEIRFFLAQGDFPKARRELKMLLARAKDHPRHRDWLDLLHLLVWMEGSELPAPDTESLALACLEGTRFDKFQEAGWGKPETPAFLGRVARRLGNEDLFESFSATSDALRTAVASAVGKFSQLNWDLPPSGPGPLPETVAHWAESSARAAAGGGDDVQQLQTELWQTREKMRDLEAENRRLKDQPNPLPEPEPTSETAAELASTSVAKPPRARKTAPEHNEKQTIMDSLKRNLGNREKTAQELGINRRTLFAKLERYNLKETNFMPSRKEVLAAIEDCGGRKNEAAQRFGMSRATFYRFLKELGIS